MKKSWWTQAAMKFGCDQGFETCLLAHLHHVSPVKSNTKPGGLLSGANAVTVCDSLLQRLSLSWATYSLALTPCRQVCNTARVKAVEGRPPLSTLARETSCGMAAAAAVTKQHQTASSGLSPLPFHFPCQFKELCTAESLTALPRWKDDLYFLRTEK